MGAGVRSMTTNLPAPPQVVTHALALLARSAFFVPIFAETAKCVMAAPIFGDNIMKMLNEIGQKSHKRGGTAIALMKVRTI
jgi:hypothetical protein